MCQFGAFLNEALRDRLVCGLINTQSQKKLLTEKQLTFEKAVEIAMAMELANKQTKEFSQTLGMTGGSSKPMTVHQMKTKSSHCRDVTNQVKIRRIRR